MKVYTIKDADGNLYPKAVLAAPLIVEKVIDGKIVEVDYGAESIIDYIQKSKGEYRLAVCELIETNI